MMILGSILETLCIPKTRHECRVLITPWFFKGEIFTHSRFINPTHSETYIYLKHVFKKIYTISESFLFILNKRVWQQNLETFKEELCGSLKWRTMVNETPQLRGTCQQVMGRSRGLLFFYHLSFVHFCFLNFFHLPHTYSFFCSLLPDLIVCWFVPIFFF